MRPSFTVSLILLSLLLSEQAQGIRLGKWHFMSSLLGVKEEQNKPTIYHEKEITSSKAEKNNDEEGNNIVCKDEECSGNSRKLFSTTVTPPSTTSTTTTSKREKMNGKNSQYSSHVNSLKTSSSDGHDQHPDQYEAYPEVGDLAEMDYSPARRKSPIHN